MSTQYTNLGPIYITAAKYEAARTAGTLEAGREYKIVDWEAQEKLIAGSNITIAEDGKTISASAGTAYSPFPTEFNTTGTLQQFGQSIINYTEFKAGCAWYGGISCTDLPGNMTQVECKVTALRDTDDYVENLAVIEIYSSEVAPYYWTYNTNSWEKGTGLDDWKYVAQIDESKFPTTATTSDIYDIKVKKVSTAASSYGWEFYVDKDNEVVANPTLAGTESDLTGIEVDGTKYKVPSEPSAYLSDAAVTNNVLTIQNKDSQEVVNCNVNYTLDNAKVKAVLSDSEKSALISGITSDLVVNTVYCTGEQDISGTKTFTGTAAVEFEPQANTNISISSSADTYSDTLKLVSGNTTGTTIGSTELDIFYNYNTGRKIIMPATDGDVELGRTGNQLKNIFVSGYLKDGDTTGSHSISVAEMAAKSTVSASSTGTSTTEAKYITIDDTEYKLSVATPQWTACPLSEGFPYLPSYGTYELRYKYNNVYYTFSAMYFDPAFTCRSCMIKEAGANRYLQSGVSSSSLYVYEVSDISTGVEDVLVGEEPETGTVSTQVFYRKLL